MSGQLPPCDDDVFKRGELVGIFDMPKEEAEAACKKATLETGRKHDWHYFGGRVRVLALPPQAARIAAASQPKPEEAPLLGGARLSAALDYAHDQKVADSKAPDAPTVTLSPSVPTITTVAQSPMLSAMGELFLGSREWPSVSTRNTARSVLIEYERFCAAYGKVAA